MQWLSHCDVTNSGCDCKLPTVKGVAVWSVGQVKHHQKRGPISLAVVSVNFNPASLAFG